MADVHEADSSLEREQMESENALNSVKKDLEGYRELLLPINKVLEWEKNHYPAILVAAITFIFAIVWYLEPSVLTTFSLLGVLLCVIDFAVPTISAYLFSSSEWTIRQERQYESICIRLMNARTHLHNFRVWLTRLKAEKPKAYLLVMMGVFATLAWVGSLIDNLLLTYLLVVFVVLVPGLRRHGILQKVTKQISSVVQRLLKKGGGGLKKEN